MGDWIYYVGLMPLTELAARVQYAKEVHPDPALSKLIQRSLEGTRAEQIAEYLRSSQHFLNALVLATYGGNPDWYELGNFTGGAGTAVLKQVPGTAQDSLGFLYLSGKEKIFAIDGQHRLAGIKRALKDGTDLESEQLPIVLVGHKNTKSGMQRTRRLFTTLNKTAVPVNKRDIISLDEDDVMAIITRRLVEENESFRHPKIAVISSQAIPTTNRVCLTTISGLYDTLKLIFVFASGGPARDLQFNRPSDETLETYYELATSYFDALAQTFDPVRRLMKSSDPASVTPTYRHADGGHILFRAIGLEIVTRVAMAMAKDQDVDLPEAVPLLRGLPTDIAEQPYAQVIWDPAKRSINVKGKVLARELLLYLCSLPGAKNFNLEKNYAQAIGAPQGDALGTIEHLKLF